jgi:hypothetical protein
MMTIPTESSQAISLWLAELWRLHKLPSFRDYIMATYGRCPTGSPAFECVYIAEAESGDPSQGQIGSIIKHWWKVDDSGLVQIRRPSIPELDEPGVFDRRPVLKFFKDDNGIVLGERLGPDLICRKTGKLIMTETGTLVKGLKVVWVSN